MTAPIIRKRTAGERRAYLQGHLSALRLAVGLDGLSAKSKRMLLAHIEIETKQLESETAVRQ